MDRERTKEIYIDAVRKFLIDEGCTNEEVDKMFDKFLEVCLKTWGMELNVENFGDEILRLKKKIPMVEQRKQDIRSFDRIECDNGATYEVMDNWTEEYDYFLIDERGEIANEVNDFYLNYCYHNNKIICTGEDEKRTPLYAKIVSVFDFRGNKKN